MAGGTFGTAITNDLQYKKMTGDEYPIIALDQDFQFVKIAGAKKVEHNIAGQNQNLTIDGNILILTSPDDCSYSSINNDDKYDELFIYNNSTGKKKFISSNNINTVKNGFFKPKIDPNIVTNSLIEIGAYETITFKRVNGVWYEKAYGSVVTIKNGTVPQQTYDGLILKGGIIKNPMSGHYFNALLSYTDAATFLFGSGKTTDGNLLYLITNGLYRKSTGNSPDSYLIYDESNLTEATIEKAGIMPIDDKKYVDKGKELAYITNVTFSYPTGSSSLRVQVSKRKWQASGGFDFKNYYSDIPLATSTRNGLLGLLDFNKLRALDNKKIVYGDIILSTDSSNVVNVAGNYIDYSKTDNPVSPFKVGITLPLANENYTGAISKEFFVKLRDLYTKSEIDSLLTGVYKPKGSVADITALYAIANPRVGDVYNVMTDGKNYVFVGVDQFPDSHGWDSLSGIVDMSNYYTKTEANNTFLAKTGGTLTGKLTQTMNGVSLRMFSDSNLYYHYNTTATDGHAFNKSLYVEGNVYIGYPYTNKAWHQGNDGSGSGLDADLLDGLQATAFPLVNGTRATGTWGISVTGNAATATKFAASKTLWGQTFDGSGNVSGAISGTGHVTPAATGVSDIGSASLKYRNIYGNLVGNVTGTVTGGITGNAATASKLATARIISLTGNASGSASFDGSANISITTAVAFANIGSKPTTLAGYGITDAPTKTGGGASGTWAIAISGNAATANKLATARTISLTGAATGSASFDGSANISISTAVAFANIGSKPTTLTGYGITDAYTKTQSDAAYPVKNANPAQDLNNINGFGIMCNPANANATSARHYPIEEAGALFYGTGAYSSACQIYGAFSSNRWFVRGGGSSATAKTAWRELIHTGNYTSLVPTKTGSGASGTWGISVTGNASTATKLAAARTISLTGAATGSASFDGSGNVAISTAVSFANVGSKPTTLAGYGITDAPTKTGSGASGSWAISVTGNAATATKLATARNIALSGKVTGSANFDGSGNISIATSIAEATTAASGLMSAADKTKLNKSVQSSNATVLDIQSVSALPSNPVATTLYIVV